MPYSVGSKGSYGCDGYPVVKDGTSEVMGCHDSAEKARAQITAINMNENKSEDTIWETVGRSNQDPGLGKAYEGCGCPTCKKLNVSCEDCPVCQAGEMKSDCCGNVNKKAPCWDGYVQRGMKPGEGGAMVPNCVPAEKSEDLWEDDDFVVYETDTVSKAEGYSPPAGARAAARKAIRFKEQGKAKGAGTSVGWTRAGQLARGETLSLSTVKRMYSYFSRHEVDKKGKNWANQSDPSNGYIMWLAWGGDAGYSWSRRIVNAEKDKALFADFGQTINKSKRMTEIFKNYPNNKDVPGIYYGEGSFVSGGIGNVSKPPKDVLGNLEETENN